MEIAVLISGLLGILLLMFILIKLISKSGKANPINFLYYVFGIAAMALLFPQGFVTLVELVQNFLAYAYFTLTTKEVGPREPMVLKVAFEGRSWLKAIIFVTGVIMISNLSALLVESWRKTDAEPGPAISARLQIHLKNAFVALVLTLALYLSISSIIAIPVLSGQSFGESKLAEQLKAELEAHALNDPSVKAEYLDAIADRLSLTLMDTSLVDSHKVAGDYSKYDQNVNSAFRKIDAFKEQAISRMQMTDQSLLSPSYKLKDKSELSSWYHTSRATLLELLDKQQVLLNVLRTRNTDLNYYDRQAEELDLWQTVNTGLAQVEPIPDRPRVGSDLGVFTFFSGWLLSVESQPLAVIIGLLGFGLLGAGASTFIREFKQNNTGKPWIEDVAGVLIKGFTAAIVVFLGVQGGLAVLSTGTGELNAYALFFIAFVAAVFSDDAWKWAKNRFGKDFDPGAAPTKDPIIGGEEAAKGSGVGTEGVPPGKE